MVKSELIARLAARNPHLRARDAEAVVSAIFERITVALAEDDRVELRNFGTFSRRSQTTRVGRNPRTGERIPIEAKAHVHFKQGRGMRTRLNRDALRKP